MTDRVMLVVTDYGTPCISNISISPAAAAQLAVLKASGTFIGKLCNIKFLELSLLEQLEQNIDNTTSKVDNLDYDK